MREESEPAGLETTIRRARATVLREAAQGATQGLLCHDRLKRVELDLDCAQSELISDEDEGAAAAEAALLDELLQQRRCLPPQPWPQRRTRCGHAGLLI